MMNYIWAGMMLLAFLSAAWQGNMQALSNAVMAGASDAVTLCIKLLGALCLWGRADGNRQGLRFDCHS